MINLDQRIPPDLADRVEHALRALRQGDTTEFDRLLDEEDASGPGIGELFEGVITEPDGPTAGVQHMAATRGFRIIREIGRGGMGIVYEAEQEEPRRKVALKVLRRIHTDEFHVKLFRREIQTLARLKHAAIATIYEAGRASEGQHFFTMELVRGQPLNVYVREQQVPLRARLRLFIGICQAVNYAHQRGVIHRDLKPANIVVGADGNTKILDFGLARITDADLTVTTMTTEAGRILGTLPYMSPEQTRGDPTEIDVRSDVYALGVVLYELLTEQLPYDLRKTLVPVAMRIICEQSPCKPSTIQRVLRGDLETITLKALEKDPARRYQSPLALAEDLERYLTDQPIQAHPPSAVYQLRKLVARHKGPCALVATLFIALVIFGVSMSAMWVQAEASRVRAESAEQATEAAIDYLIRDMLELAKRNREEESGPVTVRDVLDTAALRAQFRFNDQPRAAAYMRELIGTQYLALGLHDEAEPLLREVLAMRKQVRENDPAGYAKALRNLATLHRDREIERHTRAAEAQEWSLPDWNVGPAEALYEQALAVFQDAGPGYETEVAGTLLDLGTMYHAMRSYAQARTLYRQALALYQQAGDHRSEADALNRLANLERTVGDLDAAEQMQRRALELRREHLGNRDLEVADSLMNLASLLKNKGDYAEAEDLFLEALGIYQELLEGKHWSIGAAHVGLGAVLAEAREPERAIVELQTGLDIFEQTGRADSLFTIEVRGIYGDCLTQLGRYAEAEPLVCAGYEATRVAKGDDDRRTRQALRRVVTLYEAWSKPAEAARYRALAQPQEQTEPPDEEQ